MFSSFSISFQSFNTLLCYFRPNFNNAAHRTKITSFPAICHSPVYTFKGRINSFYQTITEVLQMHRGFLEHPSSHECSLCSCVQGCARGQTNKSWMDFSSSLSKDSGSSVPLSLRLLSIPLSWSPCCAKCFHLVSYSRPLIKTLESFDTDITFTCPRNPRSVQCQFCIGSYLLSSIRHLLIHLMYVPALLNSANV